MKYLISIILIINIVNAKDINIIASKGCDFDTITTKSLKDLFMKKTRYYQQNHIEVFDNDECYKKFISTYLSKSPSRMRIYWTRMIFTGSKKPPKKISDENLIKSDTDSCKISYTKLNNLKGWKILNVIP